MNTSINNTLDAIHKIVEGKPVAQRDITRLAHLGIRRQDFEYIYKKTSGPDNLSSNGTRVADWTSWEPKTKDEVDALRNFQAATSKDIDMSIVKPETGDLPLLASTPAGKLILKLKTFAITMVNRVLMPAIQDRSQLRTYTGTVSMLTMGTMSYIISQTLRGEKPNLEFDNLAMEAIDRSGIFGVYMEAFDIFKSLGVIPGDGPTRYLSRGYFGAIAGPGIGMLENAATLLNHFAQAGWGTRDLTTTDMEKVKRFAPLLNWNGLAQFNDKAITFVGEKFDLEETRKDKD